MLNKFLFGIMKPQIGKYITAAFFIVLFHNSILF